MVGDQHLLLPYCMQENDVTSSQLLSYSSSSNLSPSPMEDSSLEADSSLVEQNEIEAGTSGQSNTAILIAILVLLKRQLF